MKIFLSSNHRFKPQKLFAFLFSALAATLLVSQLHTFISQRSVPASSTPSVQNGPSVMLTLHGSHPEDSVSVYVNGEQTARFSDGKVSLSPSIASVIEVMSESDAVFEVSAEAGEGTALLMDKGSVVCGKGMNYICRCYRTP